MDFQCWGVGGHRIDPTARLICEIHSDYERLSPHVDLLFKLEESDALSPSRELNVFNEHTAYL